MLFHDDYKFFFDKAEDFYEKNKWIEINYNDIKLNDIIIIYFTPYSQKYLNELYPKYDHVIDILNNNNYNFISMEYDEEISIKF